MKKPKPKKILTEDLKPISCALCKRCLGWQDAQGARHCIYGGPFIGWDRQELDNEKNPES